MKRPFVLATEVHTTRVMKEVADNGAKDGLIHSIAEYLLNKDGFTMHSFKATYGIVG